MIAVLPVILLAGHPAMDCDIAMTQADMNQCAYAEYKVADRRLNEAWIAAADRAKATDKRARDNGREAGYFAKLREAQRAWIKSRDAHCDVEADQFRGGSIVPLIHSTCKTELTRERTKQLADYVETET